MAESTDTAAARTPRRITRRRALQWTLGGLGGLVGLGGAATGGLLGLRGCAPSVPGLRVLGDHGYRTFANLVATIVPPGGAFPDGADPDRIARLFDAYLADEPEAVRDDLLLAVDLVELGPVLFDGRLATFSNLPPAERLPYWDGWATSDSLTRRKVHVALRKFVLLVSYDDPALWPHVGWPGPPA